MLQSVERHNGPVHAHRSLLTVILLFKSCSPRQSSKRSRHDSDGLYHPPRPGNVVMLDVHVLVDRSFELTLAPWTAQAPIDGLPRRTHGAMY